MTSPYSFLYDDAPVSKNDYSFLYGPKYERNPQQVQQKARQMYEEENTFFEKIGNLTKFSVGLGGVFADLLTGNITVNPPLPTDDPSTVRFKNIKNALLTKSLPDITAKAFSDVSKIFSPDDTPERAAVIQTMKDAGESILAHPIDAVGGLVTGLPSAILEMAVAPMKYVFGVKVDATGAPILTDEEQVHAAKETMALIVTEGTAGILSKVPILRTATKTPAQYYEEATSLIANARNADDFALGLEKMKPVTQVMENIAGTNALPQLPVSIAKGIAKGSISGAAYGAVAGANEEDQIEQVITNGILFGTIGSVFEVAGLPKNVKQAKTIKELGSNLENWRKVTFDINKSYQDMGNAFDAVALSNNMNEASLKNWIKGDKKVGFRADTMDDLTIHPDLVQGITDGTIKHFFTNSDYQALVPNDLFRVAELITKDAEGFIKKTDGLLPGQAVTVDGKLGYLDGSSGDKGLGVNFLDNTKGTHALNEISNASNLSEGLLIQQPPKFTELYTTIKEDLTNSLLSQEPLKFDDIVNKHTKDLLTTPSEKLSFKMNVINRLGNELHASLPEADRLIIDDLVKSFKNPLYSTTFPEYSRFKAATNNLDLVVGDGGTTYLIDQTNGKSVGTYRTMAEAKELSNRSGSAQGWELMDGGLLPNEIFQKLTLAPEESPMKFRPAYRPGKMQTMVSGLNLLAPILGTAERVAESLDNISRTAGINMPTKFKEVFDNLVTTRNQELAARRPWDARREDIGKLAKGMSEERLELIGQYMQSLSPDEVISSYGMKPYEVDAATRIADLGQNSQIGPALKFGRLVNESELKGAELELFKQETAQQLGLDLTNPGVFELVKILDAGREVGKKEFNLGSVTRLARSIADDSPTARDFAKHNEFTPQELLVGDKLKEMYAELAPEFGITKENTIAGYMAHARLYTNGNMQDVMSLLGQKESKFFAELARTGELDSIEMNPLRAMDRYIRGGFMTKIWTPEFTKQKEIIHQVLGKDSKYEPTFKASAERWFDSFMGNLRGWNAIENKMADSFVDKMVFHLTGKSPKIELKNDIVHLLTKTTEIGVQGGLRLKFALMDLSSFLMTGSSRWGFSESIEMLTQGVKAVKDGNKLIAEGKVPSLDFRAYADPTGVNEPISVKGALNKTHEAVDKVGSVAFKLTGQQHIYSAITQGAYIVGETRGLKAASDYVGSKTPSIEKLVEDAKLDSYSPHVKEKYISLVTEGKSIEAGDYLGRQTVNRAAPTYGLGNSPYKWNTWYGRLAGQFGTYSMWLKGEMEDLLANGSIENRFAKVSRLLAANMVLNGVSSETGLDLSNWYTPSGLIYTGSPIAQTGIDALKALPLNPNDYTKQQARRNLEKLAPSIPTGEGKAPYYVPFGLFYNDIIQAQDMHLRGADNANVAFRGVGVKSSKGPKRTFGEVAWEDMVNFDY